MSLAILEIISIPFHVFYNRHEEYFNNQNQNFLGKKLYEKNHCGDFRRTSLIDIYPDHLMVVICG